MALSQILPNMREEMELSIAEAGILLSVINIGTLVAYVLIRKADAWGRRRVLMVTIPRLHALHRADRARPGAGVLHDRPVPRPAVLDRRVGDRDGLRRRGVPS